MSILTSEITNNLIQILSGKLQITPEEMSSLRFQIDWFKNQLELDAYVSTNHLMGNQEGGLTLPIVTFDEDNEIEELQMPHEVDWSLEENADLLERVQQRGLKLSLDEPSPAFNSLFNVALTSKVQTAIEETIKLSREQGNELGLYLVEHPFIAQQDNNNRTIIDFTQIAVNTVEAGVTAKAMAQSFDKAIQSPQPSKDMDLSQGINR